MDVFRYVKREVQSTHWDVFGWWVGKRSTDSDDPFVKAKCHLVNMVPQSEINKWAFYLLVQFTAYIGIYIVFVIEHGNYGKFIFRHNL